MGRRLNALAFALLFSASAVLPVFAEGTAAAAETSGAVELSGVDSPAIEQISANMPEVTVYGYHLSDAGDSAEANLGGKPLKIVSNQPFAETGEGVDYYFLMDVSNSIPDSYFKEIKESAVAFGQGLRDADRVTFITFGETVQLRGDLKGDPAAAEAMMKEIRNTDNRTLLFEAISKAADLASKQTDPGLKRKVFLVVSDGEDVADGKAVAQEALNELKEKGISVYALCINDTARDHKNSFGEFARNSGGSMEIFRAKQCGEAVGRIRDRVMSADRLEFQAGTNRVSHTYERFNLELPGLEVPLTQEVFLYRYQDDLTAPEFTAEGLGGREIRVSFSETVTGAGDPASYQLRSEADGQVIPISGVAVEDGRENTVVISAADAFPAGTYTLSCPGIRDDSQNENAASNAVTLELEQSDEEIAPVIINEGDTIEGDTIEGDVIQDSNSKYAMAAALLALTAGIIAIILALRARSKKTAGGSVTGEETIYGPGAAERTHVKIEQGRTMDLVMTISVAGRNPQRITRSIDRSLIVGRASICDLYFDDPRMSKQHFALEWDGQNMFVQDLHSTNGTLVNGVRLSDMKRRIERGDRISAGGEEIVISW